MNPSFPSYSETYTTKYSSIPKRMRQWRRR